MRVRGVVLIAALAFALAACVGGPTPDGIQPNELSARVHENTRLAEGSCGTPIDIPSTVSNWVQNAPGLVRGKVLKLERGPLAANAVWLQVRMQVISAYGSTNFNPGDEVFGEVLIWNQGNEDDAWNTWGVPLTIINFSDQTEALLPVHSQYGSLLAGRTCFPIMFGTDAGGAYLGGTHWGTLDDLETAAAKIVEPPPPPPPSTTTTKPPTSTTKKP